MRKVAHLNSLVSEAQAELKGVAERQALREKSLNEFLSITERSRDARSNRGQGDYPPQPSRQPGWADPSTLTQAPGSTK